MKRYIYATVLLSVILPAVLVAPFHHHARLYPDDNQCDACDQHLPHQGHLASASGTDVCLICKILGQPYVPASETVEFPFVTLSESISDYGKSFIPAIFVFSSFPRAPPISFCIR